MKKTFLVILITAIAIAILWTILTIWVDRPSAAVIKEYGDKSSTIKALIVYDADPIYNLDEQLCNAFAEELAQNDIHATVATVKAAEQLNKINYHLYTLCANTYNWRPDRAITKYITKSHQIKGKNVVALTLGSGSTIESKEHFDEIIRQAGAKLIDSKTLWLLRPNDESKIDEPNVKVAISITKEWAKATALNLSEKN